MFLSINALRFGSIKAAGVFFFAGVSLSGAYMQVLSSNNANYLYFFFSSTLSSVFLTAYSKLAYV